MTDSALAVLEEAIASRHTAQTAAVRAALRELLPHSPDRSGLIAYWTAAGREDAFDRRGNMIAALNRIRLILDGWRQDGSPNGLLKPPRGRRRR